MKRFFYLTALIMAVNGVALGQPKQDPTGKGRYTLTGEKQALTIFTSPAYDGSANFFDGYSKKTAEELNLVGQEFWNEFGDHAEKGILAKGAVLYFKNGFQWKEAYLDQCMKGGKPYYNRVLFPNKEITEAAPPKAAEPEKKIENSNLLINQSQGMDLASYLLGRQGLADYKDGLHDGASLFKDGVETGARLKECCKENATSPVLTTLPVSTSPVLTLPVAQSAPAQPTYVQQSAPCTTCGDYGRQRMTGWEKGDISLRTIQTAAYIGFGIYDRATQPRYPNYQFGGYQPVYQSPTIPTHGHVIIGGTGTSGTGGFPGAGTTTTGGTGGTAGFPGGLRAGTIGGLASRL
jgi:hypothetical protein